MRVPAKVRSGWRLAPAITCVALAAAGAAPGEEKEKEKAAPASATALAPTPIESRLKTDVSFLADDAREGRAPGTSGIEAAAAYISGVFQAAGLKPAPGADGFFQPFQINGEAKLASTPELSFAGPEGKALRAEKDDLSPLAIGTGGSLEGVPVVFAGYGITARDAAKKLDYDDYAGLDVKGKLVLILRREPQQDREDSPFDGKIQSPFATFRHKATNAFQHGAAGVLLVNDSAGSDNGKNDQHVGLLGAGPATNSALPFVMVRRSFADRLLSASGMPNLAELEKQIDADLKPRSKVLEGWKAVAKVDIQRTRLDTRNVVGVLEGSGPLADETVVVGAHYDHLGRSPSEGSLAPGSKDIHNGADDNASGTAMLLETARRLARRPDALPRRVVFIAFSGEERGLLGSQHYVDHPLFPLKNTVMMINFDMVGRLNAKNELTVYGTGTSPGIEGLVDALGKSQGFTIKKIAEGYGPSDQQSFYVKDIPVLFTFTGTHADYHRPSDDTERINFGGMSRIADLAELLLLDIARRPERPGFIKVASKGHGNGQVDPGRVAISAYFGSMPDYDESIKGVKLNGVREGSPAEKAGLKAGDIVVGFGDKPVGTIQDYTESLARYKPGDTADVKIKRDGKDVTLKVTFGRRPSQ